MKFGFVIVSVVASVLGFTTSALAVTPTLSAPKTSTLYKVPLTTTSNLTLKPQITGYGHSGCIKKGSRLIVNGSNFGTQKGLSLGGHGINVNLPITSWSSSKIYASIPNDSRIKNGEWYYVGVKDPSTNNWLSNIDKNITICAATTTTTTTTTTTIPNINSLATPTTTLPRLKTPTLPGTDSTPTQPDRSSNDPAGIPGTTPSPSTSERTVSEAPSDDAYSDYYGYDDGSSSWENYGEYGPEPATPTVLPNSYGTLMDRQLPPPPPNLALKQKQDAFIKRHTEPGELVVISANMDEAKQLAQQLGGYGLQAKRRKILKSLGMVISTFRVPAGADMQQLTANVRQAYPSMWVDMNHRYQLMGNSRNTSTAKKVIRWQDSPGCGRGLRIGLVDTGVDKNHPALQRQQVIEHSVLTRGIKVAKPDHGTAVASLLIGDTQQRSFSGLVPGAKLFSVSVFRQRDKRHTDTTAEWIVSAIDWLLSQKVQAINMSIGGPRNLLVDVAIQRTIKSGVTVIASAGNGGPQSLPVYPAAQPGVIAVTAVDDRGQIYERASHGSYIDFSAPGVDLWAANDKKSGKFFSGTSFATPYVTASMALLAKDQGPRKAYEQLQTSASDLGVKGKDDAFGWGLLQLSRSCK